MILTSDVHFTDKEEDAYRWGIFSVLHKEIERRRIKRVFILGDLTVFKDLHSSRLVNTLVSNIVSLTDLDAEVHILKGNHDYIDSNNPFFGFLDNLPNVYYYSVLSECATCSMILMVPHSYSPVEDWGGIKKIRERFNKSSFVFMHQTIEGSVASNGTQMSGISRKVFKGIGAKIVSGDIHVRQDIGNVTYVGAPHPVNFGDTYFPRVLVYDESRAEVAGGRACKGISIPVHTINKSTFVVHTLEDMLDEEISKGDQVKIRLVTRKGDDWETKKKALVEHAYSEGASRVLFELLPHTPFVFRHRLKDSSKTQSVGETGYTLTKRSVFRRYVSGSKLKKGVVEEGRKIMKGRNDV